MFNFIKCFLALKEKSIWFSSSELLIMMHHINVIFKYLFIPGIKLWCTNILYRIFTSIS